MTWKKFLTMEESMARKLDWRRVEVEWRKRVGLEWKWMGEGSG